MWRLWTHLYRSQSRDSQIEETKIICFSADGESQQAGSQLPHREELPHEFRVSLFSPRRNTSRERTTVVIIEVTRRVSRRSAPSRTSPRLAAPRDNEQWDEQIRIAERLGEDPRKMEFEAFASQPQKREERKKLFTKRHREPSTPS